MIAVRLLIEKLCELRRTARSSRDRLEALQQEKFRALVRYVNARSPFYRQIIKERGIDPENCTPGDFPILTKTELLENFDRIVTEPEINLNALQEFLARSSDPGELLLNRFHVLHTSGSSGETGYFVYSKEDWARGIVQLARQLDRSNRRALFRRRRIAYFGAIGGHFAGVSMVSIVRSGLLKGLFRLFLFEINSPVVEVVRGLNRCQPDILSGYTTALKILAEKQLQGSLNISPLLVSSGGEVMATEDRELLSRAFGCPIKNNYASSELLICGSSTPDGTAMRLFDDDLIFEFHEDHSIVTNLFNRTLPLIRYRTSDVFLPAPRAGKAGRPSSQAAVQPRSNPYLVVDSIIGRSEQVPHFINQNGHMDFISPHTIIEFFVPGVNRFQMRVLAADRFRFLICLGEEGGSQQESVIVEATRARLQEILRQKAMSNVQFDVRVVRDLPVDSNTGKFRLIVDETGRLPSAPAHTPAWQNNTPVAAFKNH